MGICPQKIPSPDSQIVQDALEQSETIFQDVRRNTMQTYIKYKAYYDIKANASKLKQSDYVYILHQNADHQGSRIPFTDFRWIGPYIDEKALPKNNYLVRNLGTKKTQVLHRMRLPSFTPRQPVVDVQATAQEWKPDPEVIIKHDDLYARAWESEYETSIFDNDQHEPDRGNSPEVTVRHDLQNDETCTIPGTIQEDSPGILPHTDEIGDGTDTDHYMSLMRKWMLSHSVVLILTPAAQNMICATILNRIAMTTTDIKLQIGLGMVPGTTTDTTRGF